MTDENDLIDHDDIKPVTRPDEMDMSTPYFVLPPWNTGPDRSDLGKHLFVMGSAAYSLRNGHDRRRTPSRQRAYIERCVDSALDLLSDEQLTVVADAWDGSESARAFSGLQRVADVVDVGQRISDAVARRRGRTDKHD